MRQWEVVDSPRYAGDDGYRASETGDLASIALAEELSDFSGKAKEQIGKIVPSQRIFAVGFYPNLLTAVSVVLVVLVLDVQLDLGVNFGWRGLLLVKPVGDVGSDLFYYRNRGLGFVKMIDLCPIFGSDRNLGDIVAQHLCGPFPGRCGFT